MLAAALFLAASASAASFKDQFRATRFLKVNLHAHTDEHADRSFEDGKGDGDGSPSEVVSWYAGKGYAFTALTDHNELTRADAALLGVELTSQFGPAHRPVHVGAVCVDAEARGVRDPSPAAGAAVLQKTIAAAQAAHAKLIVVNHPNWEKGVEPQALLAAKGFNALEIASGHPGVERDDAAASESAEALWEDLLASGRDVFAVAADDAHDYHGAAAPHERDVRAPGRAWVELWSKGGDKESACAALGAGRFYATTGPELRSLSLDQDELDVEVAGNWNDRSDRIELLGPRLGSRERVVAASRASSLRYNLKGGEGYVRVRITQGGHKAWTQAYRVR